MEGGGEGRGEGDYIIIYLSLHCHYQNDSCIRMVSDDGRFMLVDRRNRESFSHSNMIPFTLDSTVSLPIVNQC